MTRKACEKWLNEQREIQSLAMHSSQTKIFVDFMKNYTTERVYVDIPEHVCESVETKMISGKI